MRLSTLPIPLVLSSVALAHFPLGARPGHHDQVARRNEARYPPLVGRQTTADDNGSGNNLLGGLLGETEDTTSTTTGTSTRTTTSITSTTSTTTSSSKTTTTTSQSASPTSTSSTSSITHSVSDIISASVSNSTSSVTSTSSSASASASSSSSIISSSSASSVSQSSAPVMTITEDGGSVKVITKVLTATPSASSIASSSAEAGKKSDSGDLSTGAIIGISVGVGAVVLTLIAFAIWRMRRRGRDDDDIIRWPELNRHGDSDTHHALPARQTGQHGFETGLERSLSNSSSIYASTHVPPTSAHSHGTAPMPLNGSNFGAASSLEDYDYSEKSVPPVPTLPPLEGFDGSHHSGGYVGTGYDVEDDYTNMPPPVQLQQTSSVHAYGGYDSEDDGGNTGYPPRQPSAGAYDHGQMSMAHGNGPASYHHGH